MKRAASIKKQPYHLTNFSPFGAMTAWTWWKSIRIIIQSDYLSTFYAFIASFSRFFSCSVHINIFKRLKTSFKTKLSIETLLTTFFCWTNFYFLSYSSSWSSCSFSFRDKLSSSSISDSCRCFTHDFLIFNYKTVLTYYLTEQNKFSSVTKKNNIQLI